LIILVETSALVSASICFKYEMTGQKLSLRERTFAKCCALLEFCKTNNISDTIVITKTVEEEARHALRDAVERTIRNRAEPDLIKKYGIMVLQHLVENDALDRFDYYVEECSVKPAISRTRRELVKTKEIEPYVRQLIANTSRYIQPRMPRSRFMSISLKNELIRKIAKSLPRKATIYKGMPEEKDLIIMAEATLIFRKFEGKTQVYIASLDNHFKPNPVLVLYIGGSKEFMGWDSTVRDKLAQEFGFIGEEPKQMLYLVTQELLKSPSS
jgi:hypothetical protein